MKAAMFLCYLCQILQKIFRASRTQLGVVKPIEADSADQAPQTAALSARGSTFYAAMRILPPDRRAGMYEIYSFCRQVDDIADSEGPRAGRLEALEQWRSDIDALYGSASDAAASARAASGRLAGLASAIARFSLDRDDFIAVIDGMEMDVVTTIVGPDAATLDLYCDRVASAVGRLSVKIFGMPTEAGRVLSHHLGRALQLTNILRDIDEDAGIGRVYLPAELLLSAGVDPTPAAVQANALDAACAPLVGQAREHFRVSRTIIKSSPRRTVIAPAMMANAYGSLLDKLIARGFTPPRKAVRVSKLRKARLALTVLRHVLF
jgi:squalene synthase HpnD